MQEAIFGGWSGLARVVGVGVPAYVALVVLLRVSGKRTLSKMNAFDLIVTVALGSTLATILLSEDVSLAEGVLALGLLIGLQLVVTWASVRSGRVSALVKAEPSLVVRHGKLLEGALRRERVTADEVHAAIRQAQLGSLEEVDAVVLETDGSLSIIPASAPLRKSTGEVDRG